jgi:hypothetical protein
MSTIARMLKELEKQKKKMESELNGINQAIAALGGLTQGERIRGKRRRGRPVGRKRTVSKATRQKMIAAQQRRRSKEKASESKGEVKSKP